jgi:hypothetical protein
VGASPTRRFAPDGSNLGRVREGSLFRPETAVVELCTVSVPDLAMLIVADRQLGRALGREGRAALMSSAIAMGG